MLDELASLLSFGSSALESTTNTAGNGTPRRLAAALGSSGAREDDFLRLKHKMRLSLVSEPHLRKRRRSGIVPNTARTDSVVPDSTDTQKPSVDLRSIAAESSLGHHGDHTLQSVVLSVASDEVSSSLCSQKDVTAALSASTSVESPKAAEFAIVDSVMLGADSAPSHCTVEATLELDSGESAAESSAGHHVDHAVRTRSQSKVLAEAPVVTNTSAYTSAESPRVAEFSIVDSVILEAESAPSHACVTEATLEANCGEPEQDDDDGVVQQRQELNRRGASSLCGSGPGSVGGTAPASDTPGANATLNRRQRRFQKKSAASNPERAPSDPLPPSDAASGNDEIPGILTVSHVVLAAVAAEAHPSAAPLATSSVADSEAGLQQPKKKRRRSYRDRARDAEKDGNVVAEKSTSPTARERAMDNGEGPLSSLPGVSKVKASPNMMSGRSADSSRHPETLSLSTASTDRRASSQKSHKKRRWHAGPAAAQAAVTPASATASKTSAGRVRPDSGSGTDKRRLFLPQGVFEAMKSAHRPQPD